MPFEYIVFIKRIKYVLNLKYFSLVKNVFNDKYSKSKEQIGNNPDFKKWIDYRKETRSRA